jgi:hypothetical protein
VVGKCAGTSTAPTASSPCAATRPATAGTTSGHNQTTRSPPPEPPQRPRIKISNIYLQICRAPPQIPIHRLRRTGELDVVKGLYRYPVGLDEWPTDAVIIERLPLRSCRRRGAAIDLIVQRSRENHAQLVFTIVRGPRRGVLAVAAHPQVGAPNVRTPDGPRPWHRGAADPGRRAPAVRLPVSHPAGQHPSARCRRRWLAVPGRARFWLRPSQPAGNTPSAAVTMTPRSRQADSSGPWPTLKSCPATEAHHSPMPMTTTGLFNADPP